MCGTVSVYIELSVYVLTVFSVYLGRNSLFLFLLAPCTASSHNTLPKYPDYSVNSVSIETHCLYVKGKLQPCVLRRHISNYTTCPAPSCSFNLPPVSLLYEVITCISQNYFQQYLGNMLELVEFKQVGYGDM